VVHLLHGLPQEGGHDGEQRTAQDILLAEEDGENGVQEYVAPAKLLEFLEEGFPGGFEDLLNGVEVNVVVILATWRVTVMTICADSGS
jgi:hypothetical protein